MDPVTSPNTIFRHFIACTMTTPGPSQQRQPQEDEYTGDIDTSDAPTGSMRRGRSRARTPRGRQTSGSNSRQFLFIDANADRSTSGEAVRVHVMREAHRTRREKVGSQSQNRRTMAQDEMVILDLRGASGRPSQTPPSTTAMNESPTIPATTTPTIDWSGTVRAGVATFTLESLEMLHRLAQGQLSNVRPVQPNVLDLCQRNVLSLCAYLALAALQLASSEQDQANVASAQFEARALELLRLRIVQTGRVHTDNAILAVLLLSRLEEYKNNQETSRFHQNALQRLVRDRGGLPGVRLDNTELADVLSQCGFVEEVE